MAKLNNLVEEHFRLVDKTLIPMGYFPKKPFFKRLRIYLFPRRLRLNYQENIPEKNRQAQEKYSILPLKDGFILIRDNEHTKKYLYDPRNRELIVCDGESSLSKLKKRMGSHPSVSPIPGYISLPNGGSCPITSYKK